MIESKSQVGIKMGKSIKAILARKKFVEGRDKAPISRPGLALTKIGRMFRIKN